MLSVLVWNSVRLISSSHAERLEIQVDQQTDLLANLMAPGLAAHDRAILLDNLSLLTNRAHIVYASVHNLQDQLMAEIGNSPEYVEADTDYISAKQDGVFDAVRVIKLFGQDLGRLQIGYSIKGVENLVQKTRFQNSLIAAVEIILSVFVTVLLGFVLTRSLRKLEEGAKALTRDELHHRIQVDSNDEMGDLARSFNTLAEHLAETRLELLAEHEALEQKTGQMQTLLDGVDAVIVEAEVLDGHYRYVSRESERLLGYPAEDWLKAGFIKSHSHPEDGEILEEKIGSYLDTLGSFVVDFRMFHREGHTVWVRAIHSLDIEASGKKVCRGLLLDVTEQKHSEERIVYLAEHDSLTGLYNRHRFQQELVRSLDYAQRFSEEGALMFVDLDQFKYINDSLGHQAGDKYLCVIAERLASKLRKVDVLARLGGDEFGIILPNTNRENAERVAGYLLNALAEQNNGFGEIESPVTASIGIVTFPMDDSVSGNLLAMADAAMYRVKENGRNGYHTYRDGDQTLLKMQAKLQWEQRIRNALENDKFVLHFQPIFRLTGRAVVHYEVLLRMIDEDGSLIPPDAFLDVAERFGMIREIDQWVLRNALAAQAQSETAAAPLSLAINLSGRHFGDPDVLQWVNKFLQETGANPSRIIFEITETAAVENLVQATSFISALHAMGCRLALDDFGVGFSSFHYLKHLPVDIIKLDGSFIRNLASDSFDRVFVKAMSDMAKGLNIQSVAEFVEDEDVISVLVALGVDMGQGYHLGRPRPDCPYPCVLSDATQEQKQRST